MHNHLPEWQATNTGCTQIYDIRVTTNDPYLLTLEWKDIDDRAR